jgi:hypothetical protein
MAVERLGLGCDRLAQRRHAGHRRVLVVAGAHRLRHRVDQARVAVEVGKALAQVDRTVLLRQRRHDGEDGRADVRQAALGQRRAGKGADEVVHADQSS